MTRAGTKIQFTALPFLFTPFVCLSTNQIDIDQPRTSYRNTGSPVCVVDIAIYQDLTNDSIIIYPYFSGEEGFFDLNDIENITEINSLMFGEDWNSNLSEHSAIKEPSPTNPVSLNYNSGSPSEAGYIKTVVVLHNSIFDNVTSAEQDEFLSKILRKSGDRLQITNIKMQQINWWF